MLKTGAGEQWHAYNECRSLFCMPINEEFENAFEGANPYVMMQPVDDREEGHNLITAILKHRVATILLVHGFFPQEPPEELIKLGGDFNRMKIDLERWAWPKTSDLSHFSKDTELLNQAIYKPKEGTEASIIWGSFVTNMKAMKKDTSMGSNDVAKKRLPVFISIEENAKSPDAAVLPRIKFADVKSNHAPLSHSEMTWRELLLGEDGGDGSWKKSIDHLKRRDVACISPVSQHSYSH